MNRDTSGVLAGLHFPRTSQFAVPCVAAQAAGEVAAAVQAGSRFTHSAGNQSQGATQGGASVCPLGFHQTTEGDDVAGKGSAGSSERTMSISSQVGRHQRLLLLTEGSCGTHLLKNAR